MKRYLYLVMIGLLYHITITDANAQQVRIHSSNPATGEYTLICDELPVLSPYSTESPNPYYGMFWIFEDDGTFSFNGTPVHQFGVSNYHVSVEATPRYTPINKKPNMVCQLPGTPNPIIPVTTPSNPKYQFSGTSVYLQANRDPFFDHERTLILSYENPFKDEVKNAFLILYFDSNQTSLFQSNADFNLHNQILDKQGQTVGGIKAFNGEIVVSSPVVTQPASGNFNSCIMIEVPNVAGQSSHNIFFRFVTDVLLGQVNMMAELVAAAQDSVITQTIALNEPVVSGYDPNGISVDKDTLCIGQMDPNDVLTYTVHFQNEGNGPTQGVNVVWPFNHDLETESLVHIESKHDDVLSLPLERLGDGIQWHFELSLPGTRQLGFECDQEATKSWLTFKVETYNGSYYLNNYGPLFETESTAIIEFPDVSHMETMPATTVFTDNCSKSPTWLSNTENMEKNDFPDISYVAIDKNNLLYITVDNVSSDDIAISLFNTCGNMLYNERVQTRNTEKNNVIIPLTNLPHGLYIIKVSSNKGIDTRKIIL